MILGSVIEVGVDDLVNRLKRAEEVGRLAYATRGQASATCAVQCSPRDHCSTEARPPRQCGSFRSARRTDIVTLTSDMNTQVGRPSSEEAQLGGRFGVDAERTDSREQLLQ
ncbi:hypothetical protein T265_05112 [Opisthorchis viverrini]|uniref:Uncharacterized protein n=1 Tax=Opisthorchis viverrini TaxID=6198 RepID=A0A074ZQ91_OPIVI|nr:hypothetical protein T265_05112 [Opisthorchis viverrini]KER27992.1 hypothetical protein T265_05112 [Opisthorchis viverrini]